LRSRQSVQAAPRKQEFETGPHRHDWLGQGERSSGASPAAQYVGASAARQGRGRTAALAPRVSLRRDERWPFTRSRTRSLRSFSRAPASTASSLKQGARARSPSRRTWCALPARRKLAPLICPAARGDECIGTDSATPHACCRAQLFGLANQLEGVGSDASGEFTLSGNYTDDEIFFVIKSKSNWNQQSRTFAGKRKKDDMSISGRWWVSDGGSPSGEFILSYEDAERRFAPSCKSFCPVVNEIARLHGAETDT
jgi:hypothetical protein